MVAAALCFECNMVYVVLKLTGAFGKLRLSLTGITLPALRSGHRWRLDRNCVAECAGIEWQNQRDTQLFPLHVKKIDLTPRFRCKNLTGRSYCKYPTDIIGLFLGDCGDPGTGMPQSPVIEDWERQYNQFGNLSNGATPA